MKNLKKRLTILTTIVAFSLGLGSSALAMQGTERFNLKPAEEITKQTRFSHDIYQTNEGLKFSGYDLEDEHKGKYERVFYGATAKDEFGLAVLVYRDTTKKSDEAYNYYIVTQYKDTNWWLPDKHVRYEAYDRDEQDVDYNKFIKKLEDIFTPNRRDIGGGSGFPMTIVNSSKLSEKERETLSDSLYIGLRYKDKETNEMKDLVYVVRVIRNKDGKDSLKGYGNGEEVLQDTDGDILWH